MKKLYKILHDTKSSDKVIVFSHFIGMLKMIEHDLKEQSINSIVI